VSGLLRRYASRNDGIKKGGHTGLPYILPQSHMRPKGEILSILFRWSVAKTIFPKEKSEALILSKKTSIAPAPLRLCENIP